MSISRTEYKFVISEEEYHLYKGDISERVDADDNPGNSGDYPIVSQYYDTPDRECYWEKQRRYKSRRKIRVRIYGSETAQIPPAGFLEVKHKHMGLGVKRRMQIPVELAQQFALGDNEVLRSIRDDVGRSGRMIIDEVLGMIETRGHVPAIQIRYDRNAFSTPDGKLRITFDRFLKCRSDVGRKLLPDDPGFTDEIIPPELSIMEVKSVGPVPYWFRQRTGETGLLRRSFSKFCTALEKHDPALRSQLQPSVAA